MIRVNNKLLMVNQVGEGETILMVHGLGGTANAWYPQATVLSKYFHVVRPDMEGSGRSPVKGKISIESLVKDIIKLMDKTGIKTTHLAGHSMGTIVCQHLAANYPKRVKSLALLGPLAEPPVPARTAIAARAVIARQQGMAPIADALVQAAISQESRASNNAIAAFIKEIIMAQDAEGYARNCDALAAAKSADLSKIKCRTLLMTGDEDGVAPPPAVRKLSQRIKRSELIILNGCGHWTPIEKPAEVNESFINFFVR